jgi:hypothetical protein
MSMPFENNKIFRKKEMIGNMSYNKLAERKR